MKTYIQYIIMLTVVGILAGCSSGPPPAEKNTLYLATSKILSLDPVQTSAANDAAMMSYVYEPLFEYDYLKRPYQLIPCLAADMPDISDDGLIYTFQIKPGVQYADDPCFEATGGKGREVVAEDFVYQIKRIADSNMRSPSWSFFNGKIKGLDDFWSVSQDTKNVDYDQVVEGLEVIDDHTFRVHLQQPWPQMLWLMAMVYTAAVPREAVEFYGSEFRQRPVGTGPYILESSSYNPDAQLIFLPNPNWRGQTYPTEGEPGDLEAGLLADAGKPIPFIEKINVRVFVEHQPVWLEFLKGNLDAGFIPPEQFDQVITPERELGPQLTNKGITLQKSWPMRVDYVAFNMEDSVVGGQNSTDPEEQERARKLRQAMCAAFDVRPIIELLLNGRGIPAESPLPPGLPAYDPEYRNPAMVHDLEKARQLLVEAGYPNGRGLKPIRYSIGESSMARQHGEVFKEQMNQVGIPIELDQKTWPGFLEMVKNRQGQMWSVAWLADYPDEENFLQLLYGPNSSPGNNGANYQNPRYDELFEQMAAMQDSPERRAIIREMLDILSEDCPWLLMDHPEGYGLLHGWLGNYKKHEFGHGLAKYYRIDTEQRAQLKQKF